MLFNESKKEKASVSLQIVVLIMILSLIFGGVAGAVSSYLFFQFPGIFGFVIKNDNGLKIEKIETEKVNLVEEESATIDVVKLASPSVVSIIISKEINAGNSLTTPGLDDFFNFGPFGLDFNLPQPEGNSEETPKEKREIGGGTGFIISADGLILTNKHVVMDEQAEYTALTSDGQRYEAKVLGRDPLNDLAVLKIEAKDLTPLNLGDSDNLQIGQTVIAIGNALSEFRNTVTKGVISGIGRRIEAGDGMGNSEVIEEAIQTDAAINPGNSGGPLLDIKGQVIGINTAISSSGQLVGFAIPINEVKQVVDSIQKYGKIVRPFLGVRYAIINKTSAEANNLKVDYGALIIEDKSGKTSAIVPGSPAEKAGLEVGDIILEVNGQKIDESHSLGRILSRYNPDDEVELKILRKDEEKTVKVKLAERGENQ